MNWSLLSVYLRRIAFWFPILKPYNIFYALRVRRCTPVCWSFWRQVEGYNFLKWSERTEISRVLMGRGLLWADGETHRRQRKVMLPGFGGNYAVLVRWCFEFWQVITASQSKAFVTIFRRVGAEVCFMWFFGQDCWRLSQSVDKSVDRQACQLVWPNRGVQCCHMAFSCYDGFYWRRYAWLVCAPIWRLPTIAFKAAFDYQFGALADTKNDFMEAYMGLMYVGYHLFLRGHLQMMSFLSSGVF